MSKLVGVWDLVSSENFDEYMKAMGVGFVLRKTAASLKPTVTITNEGDNWKISTVTTFRSLEVSFVDGVEFEEDTPDGRKSKTLFKSDGPDKFIQEQRDPKTNELITTILREATEDKLNQTLTKGDVVCKRVFQRK